VKFSPRKLAGHLVLSAAAAVSVVTGVSATSASASALPVVSANVTGWHGSVRPGHIFIGQGGSPFVRSLTWTHWGPWNAESHGRLIRQIPGCTRPSYLCPVSNRYVEVTLSRPILHSGVKFFTRMQWVFHNASGLRVVQHLYFSGRGFWGF
jgi:hypothetical protein